VGIELCRKINESSEARQVLDTPGRPLTTLRLDRIMATRILPLVLVCASLAACGGGGSGEPTKAAAAEAPQCQAIRVLALGDSTMRATGDMLQRNMDARFGPGAVVVTNAGENGATSADLLSGADGNGGLPSLLAEIDPHIVVDNHGIGDVRDSLPVDGYEERMREIRVIVGDRLIFQTPNPTTTQTPYGRERVVAELPLYVDAMRRVAGETGAGVADVNAYVQSIEGWQGLMHDGLHPSPALHQQIVDNVTAPAVAEAVKAQGCAP